MKRQTITDFYRSQIEASAVFQRHGPQYGRRTMTREEWKALSTLARLNTRLGIREDADFERWLWTQSASLPGDTEPRSDVLRRKLDRLPHRWAVTPGDDDADIPF